MSSTKQGKNLLKSLLTAHRHLGCGCSDTPSNIPDIYHPIPKPKPKSKSNKPKPDPSSSSSSSDAANTSTTFSCSPAQLCSSSDPSPGPARPIEEMISPNKIEESIAVVKESEDPYQDFRESMMQMIMEKEIFSQEDLHHLLRRFLRLNSATHRPVILHAFVDVCHSLVSDPDPQADHGGRRRTCHPQPPSSSSPM